MKQDIQGKSRRSGIRIMGALIVLVKPLLHIMLLAILLGSTGYLCAISLTILAARLLTGATVTATVKGTLILLAVLAVLRGVLHYAEQYCNHYIAFRLLAIIRHKVFVKLRQLCPAKLDGHDKGNLISLITTDVELLEVFYAHTVSPIAIAAVVSAVMLSFIGRISIKAMLLMLFGYLLMGVVIPLINGALTKEEGFAFRETFGALNGFVLDLLRGLDETLQYGQGARTKERIGERSFALAGLRKKLSKKEGIQQAFSSLVILLCSVLMLMLSLAEYAAGRMTLTGVITCTVAMMGSFGPLLALASLSNNLNQTLASGERVLSLLEEDPVVEEIPLTDPAGRKDNGDFIPDVREGSAPSGHPAAALTNVSFAYDEDRILREFSLPFSRGAITGIHGASGSGKSTVLKLLMRFYDTDKGIVSVDGKNVRGIPTKTLRDMESYMTQDTHLFHDSIAKNIAIAKQDADMEEIIAAAKKASIHDFITSLPDGYETRLGELGDTLSGGERQRIGIARAFLHDAPCMLLDEPTSNIDALNEGVILKSLREETKDHTVVLVSHRASTMGIADAVYEMAGGRVS